MLPFDWIISEESAAGVNRNQDAAKPGTERARTRSAGGSEWTNLEASVLSQQCVSFGQTKWANLLAALESDIELDTLGG